MTYKEANEGYLYVISNPDDTRAFNQIHYKIGMTSTFNPLSRIHSLNSARIHPFRIHGLIKVKHPYLVEQFIHKKLKIYQKDDKEFFTAPIDTIEMVFHEALGFPFYLDHEGYDSKLVGTSVNLRSELRIERRSAIEQDRIKKEYFSLVHPNFYSEFDFLLYKKLKNDFGDHLTILPNVFIETPYKSIPYYKLDFILLYNGAGFILETFNFNGTLELNEDSWTIQMDDASYPIKSINGRVKAHRDQLYHLTRDLIDDKHFFKPILFKGNSVNVSLNNSKQVFYRYEDLKRELIKGGPVNNPYLLSLVKQRIETFNQNRHPNLYAFYQTYQEKYYFHKLI